MSTGRPWQPGTGGGRVRDHARRRASCSASTRSCWGARRTTSPSTARCCSASSAPRSSARRGRGDRRLGADRQAGARASTRSRTRRCARCTARRSPRCAAFERWSIRTVPRAAERGRGRARQRRARQARAHRGAARRRRSARERDAVLSAASGGPRRVGSAQRSGGAGDREHLRVGEILEQRVGEPVEHPASTPARSRGCGCRRRRSCTCRGRSCVLRSGGRRSAGSASRCPRSRSSRRACSRCQTIT